jgi:hypothetical protein
LPIRLFRCRPRFPSADRPCPGVSSCPLCVVLYPRLVQVPRRKRCLLLLVCLAVILFVVTFQFTRSKEVQYSGRSVSAWLADYNSPQVLNWPRQSHPADATIRALGTNSFPAIVERLRARDSKGKLQLLRLSKSLGIRINVRTQQILTVRHSPPWARSA